MDRSFTPTPSQRHHKRLARRLIELVGGVEAAAHYCRIGKSQLSDCCNPNIPAFLPSDVIEDLEAIAGDPVLTRHLARVAEYLLVPQPQGGDDPDGLMQSVTEITAELGDVAHAVRAGLTDGKVSRGEAITAIEQLDDLDQASARLRSKLLRIVDGETQA